MQEIEDKLICIFVVSVLSQNEYYIRLTSCQPIERTNNRCIGINIFAKTYLLVHRFQSRHYRPIIHGAVDDRYETESGINPELILGSDRFC